jgi:hypothetical protein
MSRGERVNRGEYMGYIHNSYTLYIVVMNA